MPAPSFPTCPLCGLPILPPDDELWSFCGGFKNTLSSRLPETPDFRDLPIYRRYNDLLALEGATEVEIIETPDDDWDTPEVHGYYECDQPVTHIDFIEILDEGWDTPDAPVHTYGDCYGVLLTPIEIAEADDDEWARWHYGDADLDMVIERQSESGL